MSQAPPQWSPDGRWWWDGQQWVPAQPPPMSPGPPNGPVKPRRSAVRWIVVGVVAVVVVLVLIVGTVIGLGGWFLNQGSGAQPPSASVDHSPPPSRTVPSPSPTPTGPGPVPCQEGRRTEACFPKITVSKVVSALKSKGFTCEESGKYGTSCTKRVDDTDQYTYRLRHSVRDADRVNSFLALGSAAAVGTNPPDRSGQANRRTIEAAKAGLELVLPDAGPTRAKILTWVQQHQGRCAATYDVHEEIDGYDLRCSNPEAIAVAGRDRTVTTWSGSVSIGAGWIR